MSKVALALGLGLALAACGANKPISKSYGVATKANMQAQIVPIDPSTIDNGAPPTSATRVDQARTAYDTGQTSETVGQAEGTSGK